MRAAHRREHAVVGAIASPRHSRPEFDTGGSHQWGDAFLARQIDERLVLQEEIDERGVTGSRRPQQWCGALRQDRVAAAVLRGGGEPMAKMRSDLVRAKQALVGAVR